MALVPTVHRERQELVGVLCKNTGDFTESANTQGLALSVSKAFGLETEQSSTLPLAVVFCVITLCRAASFGRVPLVRPENRIDGPAVLRKDKSCGVHRN
jgi:hypothetical protein